MKRNYEVQIVAYSTVVVIGAESEEEAMELALDEINYSDFLIEKTEVVRMIKKKDLDRAKRHANCVSE